MPAEDYKVIRLLGEGAFGAVYQVRHTNGNLFAMKQSKGTGNVQAEVTEVEVLLSLKIHRHIVHMFEYFLDKTNTHMCIVMEFCNGGNLEQYVIEKQPESHMIFVFMEQTADAVQYLHMNGIIHRDLKPENVLLVIQNGRAAVKVADFGIAKIADPILPGQAPVNYMQTQIGTACYQAPEVYDGHYTEKADVFSLGVIYCAILERLVMEFTGHGKRLLIFFDNQNPNPIGEVLHDDQRATRKLNPNVQIDTKIRNLINKMIVPFYKSRPTATDVHDTFMQNLHNLHAQQTKNGMCLKAILISPVIITPF
ncbi:serine/threonine-protein kinase pdik1l-A-like [Ptychodera flava]|uniref:serine/threonine-protein kinase pdik1l-A-like n=1 Tax=Ptychodera flava TaxID=63121 RepID=UPI00396AADE2